MEPRKQDQNKKPARQPERRRLERMRAKARQLGITVEEADAMTPRVRPVDTNPEGGHTVNRVALINF